MGAVFDDARFADVRDLLPESACTLVAVLGLSDAREVIRNLGGTSVAVPPTIPPFHIRSSAFTFRPKT